MKIEIIGGQDFGKDSGIPQAKLIFSRTLGVRLVKSNWLSDQHML